jgi:23S rRNA (uracil1939-C5)-methyltransferase
MVSKGDETVLEVESAAYRGAAVARAERAVVFVPFAVPGDRIRATIIKAKRKYLEAVVDEILRPSPDRVEPRCKYFGTCGGCSWQNIRYERQLDLKRDQVATLLERIGGIKSVRLMSTLPSPSPYYYRNKMEFSFGSNRWLTREEIASGQKLEKHFALGLHIPKRYDKLLDLDVCYLQSSLSVAIVNCVRQLALEQGWTCYNTHENSGYLRNLVIRTGIRTGDMMLKLVTSTHEPEKIEFLTAHLLSEFPQISTFINSINPGRSPIAAGDQEYVCHGDGTIREQIGDLTFVIGPTCFFQPNTLQAERIFGIISSFAKLQKGDTLYDLFCGLGAIGIFLSHQVRKVVGVESHEASVNLARMNAKINGIENCSFHVGDASFALTTDFMSKMGYPDVLILDPPRNGLHPALSQAILRIRPQRIVYLSCNPATQARDLRLLASVYQVEVVQPVDMFPQTYHIEVVASLRARQGA